MLHDSGNASQKTPTIFPQTDRSPVEKRFRINDCDRTQDTPAPRKHSVSWELRKPFSRGIASVLMT
jgi:hypothetical protein